MKFAFVLSLILGAAVATSDKLRRVTNPVAGQYIVTLKDGVDAGVMAETLVYGEALTTHVYSVINGFAAVDVPPGLLDRMLEHPDVETVEEVGSHECDGRSGSSLTDVCASRMVWSKSMRSCSPTLPGDWIASTNATCL